MRRLPPVLLAAVALAAALPSMAAADAPGTVTYQPPVDGPVVDPFRPPASPWGPGNRGIDYATVPGMPVRAAADGEVTFAGAVAGSLHVVVLHADGIRTSYSFLRSVLAHRGDRVVHGQPVGTAAGSLHFGARAGEVYVDPALLLAPGPPVVLLVPVALRRPQSAGRERRGLLAGLGGVAGLGRRAAGVGASAVAWAAGNVAEGGRATIALPGAAARLTAANVAEALLFLQALATEGPLLGSGLLLLPLAGLGLDVARAWREQRQDCTPAGVAPPPPGGHHVIVLVGGLGSSSTRAGVWALADRHALLGDGAGEVVRFSYRGGTTAEHPYDGADTYGDLEPAVARLRALLRRLHDTRPGATIDVVAHSQGGLVAWAALAAAHEEGDPYLAAVGALVTLGTPFRGSPLALLAGLLATTPVGRLARLRPGATGPATLPDRRTLARLGRPTRVDAGHHREDAGVPRRVRVVSIAARGDLVVPVGATRLAGARQVVVRAPTLLAQHDRLPGSPAARREAALALAGRPPTCRSLVELVADQVVARALDVGEGLLVGGPGWTTRWDPDPLAGLRPRL